MHSARAAPGPASTAKLAGRTSGTEHSVPRRYTSFAMRILRRVVRTPPGPRFHAVSDRPVAFTPAEASPRLPGRLAMPAEGDHAGRHGRRGADAFSGRLGAGRITAGDADPGA